MLLHPEDLKAIADIVEKVVEKKLSAAVSQSDLEKNAESAKKGKAK